MTDESAGFARVEMKSINDIPVTSGEAEIDRDGVPYQLRTHVYAVGSDRHSLTMFRKIDIDSNLVEIFETISESFRIIEGGSWPARPRVRTRKVLPGDAVETLAAQSAIHGDKEFMFRLMNGLRPDERLQPGNWVKVVE